jgi:hypothetical protein
MMELLLLGQGQHVGWSGHVWMGSVKCGTIEGMNRLGIGGKWRAADGPILITFEMITSAIKYSHG